MQQGGGSQPPYSMAASQHHIQLGGGGGLSDMDALAAAAAAGEDADRGGGGGGSSSGGNRWPRQETLALLKIRSEMDSVFRDATVKGPLWEEVSRKLGELGYKRSAKKCKEKFENVFKYHKRTKGTRAGRTDSKNYGFFSELEALKSTHPTAPMPTPTPAAAKPVPVAGNIVSPPSLSGATFSIPMAISASVRLPQPHSSAPMQAPAPAPAPAALPAGVSFSSDTLTFSSDTLTFSSQETTEEDDDDGEEDFESEPSTNTGGSNHKRKRGVLHSKEKISGSTHRMMEFFKGLTAQLMEKQEAMQQKLEVIEKREQDRMIREEAWRRQEINRLNRENEMMSKERAMAASRDAAIIFFLQNITGQIIQLPKPEAANPVPMAGNIVSPPSSFGATQSPNPSMEEKWPSLQGKWGNKGKEAIAIQSSHPSSFTEFYRDHKETPAAAKKFIKYDVFLSFTEFDCGSFVELVNTKLEDAGVDISEGNRKFRASDASHISLQYLEKCKVIIPIFSSYYASEKRCLDEVAKMNECRRRTTGQIILPIFYEIEPSHVQNQSGPFEEHFHHYQEEGVDFQVINGWKEALREIGSLEGCTVPKCTSLYRPDALKEIVDQVINLYINEVPLDENLIGIEQPYRSVVKMLYNTSEYRNVRVVGICGMAGIGKTTLAHAVYNNIKQFFQGCSFVSSIQQGSEEKGLHALQIQLIRELLNMDNIDLSSVGDNLQFIMDRFSNTRVLIVLDGVECLDHIKAFGGDLQYFGCGSRIILTTRKPELLIEAKVPYRYFVEGLDDLHALKLFYNHAFKTDAPEKDYCHLSTQIASSTRGIPLVIETVGSYLSNYRNKEKERWEEVLQQLRSGQYKPLQQLLKLSHDYLTKGQWHFYDVNKEGFPMGESNDMAHYDVVLSFDAQDKVKNLVESLHKRMESVGVSIFALNGDSVEVNKTGKILIPVISKSYASNSSCLEMLVHMFKCKRSSATNQILPIFCAVEPSDVKLPTPSYLSEDDEVRNQWKEALTEVANISKSSPLKTCMMEENVKLTNSICQMVLHKLKSNQLSMGNHLVRIDHHLERILELLNLEVNDVRIIAISGEVGVGKTTLAKIVCHQLSSSFEGCSFLTEIDERTRHDDGIKYLQAKMISDLLNGKNEVFQWVIEEIDVMERRFQHMKVLIILDDVTNSSQVEALLGQLDWFGSGSRIIIATQDPAIIPLPHLNYEIMTNWRSASDNNHKLFSKHTFRKDEPPPNFESLSREIVSSLDVVAYPLVATEIVGSLLYGKDVAEWKSLSEQLMKANSLEHILRICYDRLDIKQQEVFLDISCLPSDADRRIASYVWYDSQHSSDLDDMQALINMMLVKVDASNGIWMHRLVRDFGRKIVRGKSQKVSRKDKDFDGEIVLGKSQEMSRKRKDLEGKIECGMSQKVRRKDENKDVSSVLLSEKLERMEIMRTSKLDHTISNESGDESEDCVIMRQRDLIWKQCPTDSPSTLHSECLKVLDMSWSKITEGWKGWKQLKVPQLRVLNLSGCSNLMVTPVFSFCPDLRMLILEHCPKLVKMDPSIGELQRLSTLKLSYCSELSVLPKEVGCLTALTELHLDGTSLRELPVSIGRLKNLHIFTAMNCFSLSYLPRATLNLLYLTVVKLDYANITELPRTIEQNTKLHHLSLRGCHGITRLPSLVGEVERSLIELDVSKTSISELPKWITKLKALRVLKMECCFISEFPPHFGALRRLEEIHASLCRNLASLPDDVGELESLRILDIRGSCISSLPQSIQALAHLETLDCTSCNKLQNLPELPSSLTSVHVESKELPDLVNLKQLKDFTLGSDEIVNLKALLNVSTAATPNIDSFDWLPQFSLRTLRLSLPLIENLPGFPYSVRKLNLHCTKLKHIPPLPSALVVLSIQDCRSLREMPCLGNLVNLQEMEILACPEIKKIAGLESLQALRVLTISSSGIVSLKGLENLTALNRLTLLDCVSLSDKLPDLSTLKGVAVNIGS